MQNRTISLDRLFKSGTGVPSAGAIPLLADETPAQRKNSPRPVFLLILAMLANWSFLQSTEAVEPLKELRAPDKTQWTVDISPKPDARSVASERSGKDAVDTKKPTTITLVQSIGAKDRGIYRVQNRYSDQTEEDWWIISQYQYFKYKGQTQITRLLSSQNRAWNLEESDFPELYWAVGKTPELQEIGGKKMLVLQMDASKKPMTMRQQRDLEEMRQAMKLAGDSLPEFEAPAAGMLILHLNPETGLPVRFEDIDKIHHYTFEKSPNLTKVMPADIKTEIFEFEKRRAELTRAPSAPKIRNHQKSSGPTKK
jgi:hypothetical protein